MLEMNVSSYKLYPKYMKQVIAELKRGLVQIACRKQAIQ